MVVTLWASDSGAYFVGRKFGGPKLAPVISPKKTWSGFCGALFSAGIMLFLFYYLFFSHHAIFRMGTVSGRPLEFFLTGMIAGGVGQAGDLLESFFKRKAGVKDTGNLIPGHGGLLDRIDSLLLASPVFLALSWFWLR
jgi:phosphatidate cytidylyltransferase